MRLPPLIILALAMFLSSGIDLLIEQGRYELVYTDVVAGTLLLLFVVIEGFAIAAMRKAKTTMNPMRPDAASHLVTGGIFSSSRNPMYLGLLCALIAYIVYLQNYFSLVSVPLFVLVMNHLQIKPEEIALQNIFGDEYEAYCKDVRRWV